MILHFVDDIISLK